MSYLRPYTANFERKNNNRWSLFVTDLLSERKRSLNHLKISSTIYFILVPKYPHVVCHFAVPLGSTRGVPAVSCLEIKASEGASAVSGNYWLDSSKPGQVVLVYCDMSTGGKLLFCICKFLDYFYNASKTEGSYSMEERNSSLTLFFLVLFFSFFFLFFFFPLLWDIDKCVSGAHNWINGTANCTNTLGSYKYACRPGYRGDKWTKEPRNIKQWPNLSTS